MGPIETRHQGSLSRILLVAYLFPPLRGGGVQRPAKLVKTWARQGMDVAVLTTAAPATTTDPSLIKDLPEQLERSEAPDPSPLDAIRGLRKRLPAGALWRLPDRALVGLAHLAKQISVPDNRWSWLVPGYWKGKRVIRDFRPDVIVVTGPPFTPFLMGALLARSTGVPVVFDYRDPWTANYLPEHAPWLARVIGPRLERWALGYASGITAAHRAVLRYLRGDFADVVNTKRRFWVPNGYDPDDFPESTPTKQDKFVLSYTGSFYGFRNPEKLFLALDHLIRSGAIDPQRFEFNIAGSIDHSVRIPESPELRSVLRFRGYVEHDKIVSRLRQATANLVFEGVTGSANLHSPGKVYEVMRAGRPVLVICPEGTTTRLAHHIGGCYVCHPNDPDAIQRCLLQLYEAWRDQGEAELPNLDRLRFYDRAFQARRMLEFLDSVASNSHSPTRHA